MKIAICNETYRDWSMEDTFRHASETGYDGIEIAPFTIEKNAYQITDDQCSEIVRLAHKYNLDIVGLHWLLAFTDGFDQFLLTSPNEEVRQRTADYLGQLARICRRLGGGLMVFGSPAQRNIIDGISVEDANRYAIDCLRRVLPTLQEENVVLALEPLGPQEGNFMLSADWARQLVQEIDSLQVQLHLDVKAMSSESIPIRDIIHSSKNELVHFHCNDPNRRGPGMGDVCYKPVIQALRTIEYQGWLSVEVFDETVPPETTAIESLRYLRSQLL